MMKKSYSHITPITGREVEVEFINNSHFIERANKLLEESYQSTLRSVQYCVNTEATGWKTLYCLEEQGAKLEGSENLLNGVTNAVDEIDENLQTLLDAKLCKCCEKFNLLSLLSCFIPCIKCCKRNGSDISLESREEMSNRAQSKTELKIRRNGSNSSIPNVQQILNRSDNKPNLILIEENITQNIKLIGYALEGSISQIANNVGSELQIQIDKIDQLSDRTNTATNKIETTNKMGKKF